MKNPKISRETGRYFLTDRVRGEVNFHLTPQNQGEEPPPVQKGIGPDSVLVPLAPRETWDIPPCDLETAIVNRQSRRRFSRAPLSLEELSFLLWATQGKRQYLHPAAVLRTVPSAGCRHPLETYLAVLRVAGLEPGIYRYLPLDHALVFVKQEPDLARHLDAATLGQSFTGQAAATFIWAAIPYRSEWRYAEAAYKVIALDAGHVCQNLYLACEAIGAGACAIAAYNQDLADALVDVDGKEEFVIYLAPVGKIP